MNWLKRKLKEQWDLGRWNNNKASKIEFYYVIALLIIALYLLIRKLFGLV